MTFKKASIVPGPWLTAALATAACLGIIALLVFGYRATREWQRSASFLVARELEQGADLLVTAVIRDMGGVQSRVLANRDWAESSVSLSDTSAQIATAFARYPYPESFFMWRRDAPEILFFNRADRFPAWMSPGSGTPGYPVLIETDPPGADRLRQRIDALSKSRFRYVAFNTTIADRPYQIVARLTYKDPQQEDLASVMGFTVNLEWVRVSYFGDLFSQMAPLASSGLGLDIDVVDEQGRRIWGAPEMSRATVRKFPLLFLDPTLGRVSIEKDTAKRLWSIRTAPSKSSTYGHEGGDRTIVIAAAATLVLFFGLVLSLHAVQDRASLAEMRSDFVSSVTHDLKMPLANIRAVADTLSLRSVNQDTSKMYGGYLRHETKRLTRLIDNLLAYSRVTDVANVYTFEPIVPARLVNDVLQSFQQRLSENQFAVAVNVADDLPLVRADRASMILALDNLIDNAIRYSGDNRFLSIDASAEGNLLAIAIEDHGNGIPADELSAVTRKFVRGRFAQSGGTGLGLAIVSRILTDHGGTFVLESRHGFGTTARISLPVSQE